MGFLKTWQCLLLLASTAWSSELSMPAPIVRIVGVPPSIHCPKNKTELSPGLEPASGIDQTPLLFGAMQKRQSCPAGYGLCNSWRDLCCDLSGNCCQDNRRCVSAGQTCCSSLSNVAACDVGQQCCLSGCAPEGSNCCGSENRHCDAGYQCCDNGGCAPEGAQCCKRGLDGQPAYCNPGNNCYEADDLSAYPNGIQCCTNSYCTAYVGENGYTTTATTEAPEPTTSVYTYDQTVYYTFTYTWYYYAYFYTIYQAESVVTSTIDTTTTVFSVLASDEYDASSLATEYAASVTAAGPPAEASTQLATVAATEGDAPGSSLSLPTPTYGGDIEGGMPGPMTTATARVGGGATVTVAPNPGGSGASRGVVVGVGMAVGCFALAVFL